MSIAAAFGSQDTDRLNMTLTTSRIVWAVVCDQEAGEETSPRREDCDRTAQKCEDPKAAEVSISNRHSQRLATR